MGRLLAVLALSSASVFGYGEAQILDGKDLERPPNIIGLLEVPIIYSGMEVRDPTQSISLYERPGGPEVGAVRQDGIWIGKSLQCIWQSPQGGELCPYAEADYEIPALYVMSRQADDWYKIVIDANGRTAWLKTVEKFHTLTFLLNAEHFTYFDKIAWNRIVYRSPTAKTGYRHEDRDGESDIFETLESRLVDGKLWLRVKFVTDPCRDLSKTISEGWVPAVSPKGYVWAWFFSRGC